jgi:hypothetical protein
VCKQHVYRLSHGNMGRSALQLVRLRLPLGPWASAQASSELVATHDNRRVLVWPAAGPGAAPLALHHTKAFQVRP